MRTLLGVQAGQRHKYFATFICWSTVRGERRALLQDIQDRNSAFVTDHMWVKMPDDMPSDWLRRNYQISFWASADSYVKGKGSYDYSFVDIDTVKRLPCTEPMRQKVNLSKAPHS